MDLNPFHYSLDQVQKTVMALIGAAIIIAGTFIVFPVDFEQALGVVIAQVFAVIAVFASKNVTPDAVTKSVNALLAGTAGLVSLFAEVDPTTVEAIAAIVVQLGVVYAIFQRVNAPVEGTTFTPEVAAAAPVTRPTDPEPNERGTTFEKKRK